MPNKKKRNPFYYFMKELQEKLALEGKQYTMAQMAEVAAPLWKAMSLAQKEKYENMARSNKIIFQQNERLASDGTLIRENLEREAQKEEDEKVMREGIRNLVSVPGSEKDFIEINCEKKFCFIAFNILCYVPDEKLYIPIEVGAVEYSIKNGIEREFHEFIRPGPIPRGFTREALEHSELTHKIPVSGHEDSKNGDRELWLKILNFISPPVIGTENFPPLFCVRRDFDQTKGSLEWLANKAGMPYDMEDLMVWDAGYLHMELRAGSGCPAVSYVFADEELNKSTFDYIPSTRCDFHEELDSAHCALGKVKRLCFMLSDVICKLFSITVTEKHLPLRASADKPYELHIPTFAGFSVSSNERDESVVGRGVSRASSRLSESRPDSRLSEKSDRKSHRSEMTYARVASTGSAFAYDHPKSVDVSSDDDTDTGCAGVSAENVNQVPSQPAVQLRQPVSTSYALSLARAAQAPAVAPGKGIGRGQRKLQ